MKAVTQRVENANVTINATEFGAIEQGMMVLVGVTHEDTEEDADYLANKLVHLRIFDDENGKMNDSLKDIDGHVLSISQFTLYADTRKGRRPSYMQAASPEQAKSLYRYFNHRLEQQNIKVETGQFGEMMNVQLVNSGPVTIIIDSKDR
ncbi:D-aminoacyl-tRNA deacylase [Lentibacillus halophilus]|uniref:D-aminoacyl-tRNA deacylase n=1 Tax=Lentibacillus halophilus TaxID=295065 RepID=A0ABN0ZCC2_9BACI